MQQPPTGYGQSPQWYGQPQQPLPPNEQWAQQPFIPYAPQQVYQHQQGYAPQQNFPQPGQFQQQYWQTPTPPQTPKKKSNVLKYVVLAFSILILGFRPLVVFAHLKWDAPPR